MSEERTTPARWQRWLGWALLAAFLVAYAPVVARQGNDFRAFYDAGHAARLRGDIYATGQDMYVPYAPYFSLVLAPLTLLPVNPAAWIWYALKLGMMVGLLRWLHRVVREQAPGVQRRAAIGYVALPFLVLFNPFMSEFRLGQANLLVLFFSVLTVEALERGRPLRAAFFYSLAVVKVTPLVLVPWFILRRQWRFLGWSVVVGLGWLAALAAWWGPAGVAPLFTTWVESTVSRRTTVRVVGFFENQSLQGVAARLDLLFPALSHPVLGLPAYNWIWILPTLALLGVLALSAARDRFRRRLPAEEFALVSLLMLLASADSRYAHHIQLLLPLAVVVVLSARVRLLETLPAVGAWFSQGIAGGPAELGPRAHRLRRTLGILLASGFVILVLFGRDLVGVTFNHAVRNLSLHTAFDLALAALLVGRLLARRPLVDEERPVSFTPATPGAGAPAAAHPLHPAAAGSSGAR